MTNSIRQVFCAKQLRPSSGPRPRRWGHCSYTLRLLLLLISVVAFPVSTLAQASRLHRLDPQTPQGLQRLLDPSKGPLPIVSGHRGGAWHGYPENCIETFEHTLSQAYSMLEIDPRYSKDGQVVVIHDATLERTTTGTGRVADQTVAELKDLRLKDLDGQETDYQIPTLDEVIDWARGKTILVLDQKDVSAIDRAKIVSRMKAESFVMLIVSNYKDVQAVHQLNPNIMMEVMVPNRARAEEFATLGVPWSNVVAFVGHNPPQDASLYDFIHHQGASCMIGTSRNLDRQFIAGQVDELKKLESEYRAYLALGANIIETDIPAQLGTMLFSSARIPAELQEYFHAP